MLMPGRDTEQRLPLTSSRGRVVIAWDELGPRWMRGWRWEEAVRADVRLSILPPSCLDQIQVTKQGLAGGRQQGRPKVPVQETGPCAWPAACAVRMRACA